MSPVYDCGMPPARFVRLTPEEDARLRAVEQDPLLKPKVRLRAQVLRSSGRGENVGSIAAYNRAQRGERPTRPRPLGGAGLRGARRRHGPRQPAAHNRGGEGLHEGGAFGGAHPERLAAGRGDRGPLRDRGRPRGGPPAPPVAMGYRWKRTRYVPSRPPDPEEEREAASDLEELKRGLAKGSSS